MQDMITAASDVKPGQEVRGEVGLATTIVRNVLAAVVIGGSWVAVETGYFSNDRTPRALWETLERLKDKPRGEVVYEASWTPDMLVNRSKPAGYWDYYNGATQDTASVTAEGLQVTYTAPWIGAYLMHRDFLPNTVYRVVVDAKVEEQPAAILMRNRQLDLLREEIAVTNGDFKEFTAHYATPGGRFDQVRIIFMPDHRSDVKGRITIRKLRIEKLGS